MFNLQLNLSTMKIEENYRIHNSLQIHSVSDYGVTVNNLSELQTLHDFIESKKIDYFILGEGTNIIPPDRYKGLVVSLNFKSIERKSDLIRVGSSVNWNDLVQYAVMNDIYGFENLSLIPGSVGAAPIQNIGAYGVDVEPLIYKVYFFDLQVGSFNSLYSDECNFGYRDSLFKESAKIITHIEFKSNLDKKLSLTYKSLLDKVNELRLDKKFLSPKIIAKLVSQIRLDILPNPKIEPNVGSFFKNPIIDVNTINTDYYSLSDLIIWELENGLVKVGAARLIQLIKNQLPENKNVFLSKQHNLVLTTNGNATQQNVLNFAEAIQAKVKYFFNINLEIEPRVIS